MTAINLQMYSFTSEPNYDTATFLEKAHDMGYDGVELFGPNLDMNPTELRELLDKYSLQPLSMHASSTDQVEGKIAFAKEVGIPFIGIGMHALPNDEAVHAFARRLNELGRTCKDNGLTLFYHNHTQEFAPCESTTIYDVLMNETDPELVSFELDAGWAAAAGVDPLTLVSQYSGRIKLIHIKESDSVIGPQPPFDFGSIPRDENGHPIFTDEQKANMERDKQLNCVAGKGIVDWVALRDLADAHGCMGYIVEREYTPTEYSSRFEALAADVRYYKSIL